MTFETPNFVKQLVGGWPVYAVVGTALLLFSELWIDRKVDQRIALSHASGPNLTLVDKRLGQNTTKLEALAAGQLRIEGQLDTITAHLLDN